MNSTEHNHLHITLNYSDAFCFEMRFAVLRWPELVVVWKIDSVGFFFYFCICNVCANFRTIFRFLKNELVKFWKIYKWYLYRYSLYFCKNKMGGHRWNIEEGLSQTLKKCQMRGGLISNVPKIRVKCFIPLIKVNIHNFHYDHNILH